MCQPWIAVSQMTLPIPKHVSGIIIITIIIITKARDLFQPLQVGVACRSGSEHIIHGLRKCIDDHWDDDDFVVFKVDMLNAFNMVSRQAILDECATFFPEILPWVVWCYGTHPFLWHPQFGVQQGDPLRPLLFSLVLQKLAASIDADEECIDLLFHAWYLDDGVLAGNRLAVSRAFFLIQEWAQLLVSTLTWQEVIAGWFIWLVPPHPNLASDALEQFDKAAQLGLRHGGLGLRSLSLHAPAAFIASLMSSGHGCLDNTCLQQAVTLYNAKVSPPDALTVESVLASPPTKKTLSSKIDMNLFHASHAAAWLSVVLLFNLVYTWNPLSTRWLSGGGWDWTHQGLQCALSAQVLVWTLWVIIVSLADMEEMYSGAAANGAELRKLNANSTKCTELGWTCIPMAVETFGHWGKEAQSVLSMLASHLSISLSQPRAAVVADIYGRLNIILVRSVSRAILSRLPQSG
ncbi:hypothetical protein EMCRGX_G021929 [Ephydatia muelleri]